VNRRHHGHPRQHARLVATLAEIDRLGLDAV
jgi:hypothetical protein